MYSSLHGNPLEKHRYWDAEQGKETKEPVIIHIRQESRLDHKDMVD